MHFKAFLIAAISATVAAQGNSIASDLASVTSDLGSIGVNLPTHLSVVSVLATAVPSSLLSVINDPAVQSSLASDFSAGNTPSWYSALPSDVKSFINSGSTTTGRPEASVLSSLTAGITSLRSSASSVLSAASASESAADPATSVSAGGAPTPTSAIFASMAGVVGVLALAIGL